MATRKNRHEREREKVIQDRLQVLLFRMLQDEDNKYCVDCDSKGEGFSSTKYRPQKIKIPIKSFDFFPWPKAKYEFWADEFS